MGIRIPPLSPGQRLNHGCFSGDYPVFINLSISRGDTISTLPILPALFNDLTSEGNSELITPNSSLPYCLLLLPSDILPSIFPSGSRGR